jgi:selenide,water dikinase
MIQLNDRGRDAMLEVGAHAATDITGFGLAGHAYAMAEGSGVTLVFNLSCLPLLTGAEKLAHRPYLTRASATNASYVASGLRLEGTLDPVRLEFFYDAQTSGGLLISVAAGRAEDLVSRLQARGVAAACIVGKVIDRTDNALLIVLP